jgi:hypothetical protein
MPVTAREEQLREIAADNAGRADDKCFFFHGRDEVE